jgi:hypothetical protein
VREKTVSEQLFEDYLRNHRLGDFTYEPEVPGITKRPDYLVPLDGERAFFEVKEFETQPPAARVGSFDPYPPLRRKIHKAKEKFQGLKGEMCSLVLANPRHAFALLHPIVVFGAMLGNAGITMPFDESTGSLDGSRATRTFLTGGKMVRYRNGEPFAAQNTTISAVCVLGHLAEGSRRLGIHLARRKRGSREPLSVEQTLEAIEEARGSGADCDSRRLRIAVFENPYAVNQLVEDFGSGPYDERFGVHGGRAQRLFVGESLRALEDEERDAGVDPHEFVGA